jgi:hypothetical protein
MDTRQSSCKCQTMIYFRSTIVTGERSAWFPIGKCTRVQFDGQGSHGRRDRRFPFSGCRASCDILLHVLTPPDGESVFAYACLAKRCTVLGGCTTCGPCYSRQTGHQKMPYDLPCLGLCNFKSQSDFFICHRERVHALFVQTPPILPPYDSEALHEYVAAVSNCGILLIGIWLDQLYIGQGSSII